MSDLTDYYDRLRQVQFTQTPITTTPAGYVDRYDDVAGYGWQEWAPETISGGQWNVNLDQLGTLGLRSKYTALTPEIGADGRLALKVQQPGAHKYDTMVAYYKPDGQGGWVFDDNAVATRETSSRDKLEDTLVDMAKTAAIMGTVATGLAGLGGAGPLAGILGGSSTAAAPATSGIASSTPLNMAAIESGLGTAGYGYNAGAAASGLFNPATIGAGAGSMFGAAGEIIPYSADAVSGISGLTGDPTRAALYGPEGYGAGMSGAQTGAYDTVLGATGSPTLAGGASSLVGALPGGVTSGLGSAGSGIVDAITGAIGSGSAPDWLKLLIPALGGYAAYQDAKKPQLQGYGGSITPRTATQSTTQGKYGPISNVKYAAAGGMMPQQGIASQMGPRYLDTSHDGMADGIAAHIDGKQPAALSGGEFVIPADVVSHFGNGNSNAGAKQLYAMMDRIRQARTGSPQQGKEIDPNKFMPI